MSVLNIDEMRAAALTIVEDRIENENNKMDMLLRGEHPEPGKWWYIFYDPRSSLNVLMGFCRMDLVVLQCHKRILTLGDDETAESVASQYVYPNDYLR